MTTYSASAVSNTVIDYKKAITLQLLRALRDNPIALAEGASGAPRIAFEALDTWYVTGGAVGTYIFARYTGGADVLPSGTVAGSSLQPTSAAYKVNVSGNGVPTFDLGTALSGTWKCMGKFDDTDINSSVTISGATLWLRIS